MAQRDRDVRSVRVQRAHEQAGLCRPFFAPRNLAILDDALDHYGALDSLYENDMLESVPVAPGEQSNYEQAIAARRTYKRKQSQRASAPSRGSAAVAVASWRRVR